MPSSDAFALRRSGLNEFLYAAVGTEANGMTLSLVSVFARLGNDPWLEAGRLAGLPKSEATESLARIIANMPSSVWPLQAATAIATRLIALLPTSVRRATAKCANISRWRKSRPLSYDRGSSLVSVACVIAFQAGVFTPAPKPDGSGVASFAVHRPANCPVSRSRSRHPRRLDDRRDSYGPAGDSPTECPL